MENGSKKLGLGVSQKRKGGGAWLGWPAPPRCKQMEHTPPWPLWCLVLWDHKDSGHPGQGLSLLVGLGAFVHKTPIVYRVTTAWWENEGLNHCLEQGLQTGISSP